MSRVDEAMRRAAATSRREEDPVALAREPFPIEIPDLFQPPVEKASAAPELLERPAHSTWSGVDDATDRRTERFAAHVAEKIVMDPLMPMVSREQYRRLAAVLHDAQAATRTQVVMVASAVPGEGKTLTAANVALTLSESYLKRVLLIDADLRRPALHQVFRIESACGLADGLTSSETIVVRQISSTLSLLPGGRPSADPMAGLISDRMRRLIDEARTLFDWVIVDTPPLMLLPDAHLLASMVDAALLVVRAGTTPYPLVKGAVEAIGRSRIVGVVLNNATVGPHGGYGEYADYAYYGGSGGGAPS